MEASSTSLFYSYNIHMQALLRSKSKYLTLKVFFAKAYQKYEQDILLSQFHKNGHRHFLKSKNLIRNFNNNSTDIQKALFDLQTKRMKLQDAQILHVIQMDQLPEGEPKKYLQSYFQAYLKLIEFMKESKFDEEWFYSIAGWYNLQYFQNDLCLKLFLFQNKKEHLSLIDTLTWMNPHRFIPTHSTDLYDVRKESKLIEDYYKKQNISNSIPILQKIENIIGGISNSHKSRYYSRYTQTFLPKKLLKIDQTNRQQIDELFWLLNIYFKEYNDSKKVINAFQDFLNQGKEIYLSPQNTKILLDIYNLTGNINKTIYKRYIKPYIAKESEKSVEKDIECLQFLINSEADDLQTLNELIEKIEKSQKQQQIQDQLKLRVHYLVHYMNIKGISYHAGALFKKSLNQCCRQKVGNGSIARLMAVELDEKGRREGEEYFNSECLRKNRLNLPAKEDQGEQFKQDPNIKRYSNIRFCTITINTCIANSETKETVIFQKKYKRFQHSGKLSRNLQVRDTILEHYGFKINYMESNFITRIPQSMKKGEQQTVDSMSSDR